MRRIAFLQHSPPVTHLMTLIFLWLFFLLLTMAFIRGIGFLVWNVDLLTLAASPDPGDPQHIKYLRFIQVVSQIGTLLLPAVALALLASQTPASWLTLDRKPKAGSLLIVLLLTFSIYPVIDLLSVWNMNMNIPDSMAGLRDFMKEAEESATQLTEAFLMSPGRGALWSNLFMVGLLAALSEELLFRPVLLRIFGRWFGNMHWAIILSAILFAAMHLQFFTFLPRLVLGVILGYLFVWSGTVWLPFVMHFIYNSTAVVAYHLYARGVLEIDPDELTQGPGPWLYISSAIAAAALFYLVRKSEVRSGNGENWLPGEDV